MGASPAVQEIFPSYQWQLETVLRWTRPVSKKYPLDQGNVDGVRRVIPKLPEPTLEPPTAPILVPQLPSLADTLRLLWNTVWVTHPNIQSEFGDQLQLVQQVKYCYPSVTNLHLQWRLIRFDDHLGQPLLISADSGLWRGSSDRELAGFGLLAAAALAPGWAMQLGGRFPAVALTGLRLRAGAKFYTPLMSATNGVLRVERLIGIARNYEGPAFAQPTAKAIALTA